MKRNWSWCKVALRLVAATIVTVVVGGCVTGQRHHPPTSGTSSRDTDRAARLITAQDRGRKLGRGSGVSMLPIFGDDTRVVVTEIDFDALQPDMIVLYRDRHGRQVVHRLVSRQGDRWTAVGINNPQFDSGAVTRENLVGVVYAFFHSEATAEH